MKKLKAGWIGYIRSEQEFWARAGQLAQLGYRGVETPERFLLVGDVDDNMKRLHEMGLRVLCTYASLDAVRAHELKDIVRTARLLHTDRVTCYTSAVNGAFWNCPPTYDRVRRDIEQLEQLAEELDKEGMTLTYHNHAQDFQVRFRGQTCFDWMLSETEKLKNPAGCGVGPLCRGRSLFAAAAAGGTCDSAACQRLPAKIRRRFWRPGVYRGRMWHGAGGPCAANGGGNWGGMGHSGAG